WHETEQRDVDDRHQHEPEHMVVAVNMALEPIVRRAAAVDVERFGVGRAGSIQPYAAEQHAPNAPNLHAVRVGFGLALRVMLAMHGDPLAGDHARREPEPEAEKMARDRMQIERAVRLMAM